MKNNRLYALALVIFAVIVAVAVILISRPAKPIPAPAGVEKGSANATVGLDGTEQLSSLLTTKEFIVVRKATSNYITNKISKVATGGEIVPGTTTLNNDGSITYKVKVSNPDKTFDVVIRRASASVITFYIVGSSEDPTILYPYINPTVN